MLQLSSSTWLRHGVVVLCILFFAVAARNAVSWYGHPFAGMLLDPGGVVSNFGMPGWQAERLGLGFPDRVTAVENAPLRWHGAEPPAAVWDQTVLDAFRKGQDSVDAELTTARGPRRVHLRVEELAPMAWWTLAGTLLLAGALYVAAGVIALLVNPRSALARTFAKVGVFTGILYGGVFDFHTSRTLTAVFFTAFAFTPLSWVALGLRLPDDAPVLARIPWLEQCLDGIALASSAAFLFLYWTGADTSRLQQLWTSVFALSVVFFGATFLVRFARAQGVRRQRMRVLALATIPGFSISLAMAILPWRPPGALAQPLYLIAYASLGIFPLATGYALIRHDLWGSRALLSRVLTRGLAGAVATAIAVLVGAAAAATLAIAFPDALVASGLGGVTAALLVVASLSWVDRSVFAARTSYKPTVEQLSEELVSITSPDEVARAVERTVRRWLPCESVQLSLLDPEQDEAAGAAAGIANAEKLIDVRFGNQRLGTLILGPKRGDALFTDEDMDLLRTMANQGALALAHAHAYQELERRRQEQAAAWRGERAALVETVAAEIAHEIRYPINFFKSVFDESTAGEPLDGEDIDIGREEVERLERLVAGLRRMAIHSLNIAVVDVGELVDRVETLLRDALGARKIDRSISGPGLRADPDKLTQILVNVLANGLQAAGARGRVGVIWTATAEGARLVVWDDGPGFDGDPARLFAPWYTTKDKGTGLGLAITHRIVRAHGWSITAERADRTTRFVMSIPRAAIVTVRDDPVEEEKSEGQGSSEDPHRRRSA